MPASVAEKLHALWAADSILSDLLPAERVFTGRAPRDTSLPYATLSQPAGVADGQGTHRRRRVETWRIQVWVAGEEFVAGEAIQRAVEDAMANVDGILDVGGIVQISHDSSYCVQETDDPTETTWQFVTQFTVAVERPRVH